MNVYGYMSIEIGGRSYQQDACYIDRTDHHTVAVVCDGMGGMKDGDIASTVATNSFIGKTRQLYMEKDVCESLKDIIREVDQEIYLLDEDTGTTLVSAVIYNDHLYWVSVGDSKLYIIRGEQMICPIQEHIFLHLLTKQWEVGLISEEEYEAQMIMQDALISYLGMGNVSLIEANFMPFQLMDGDQIIVCSDGLYKSVEEDAIKRIVIDYKNEPQLILDYLQNLATKNTIKVQDNTSIILLQCKEE